MKLSERIWILKKNREKKASRFPLKLKLLAYFLVFAAVMLVLLWLFQIVFLDNFYRSIKTEQIKISGDSIANNIDNSELDKLITGIHNLNDVTIEVYNTTSGIFRQEYSTRSNNDLGIKILPHEIMSCYNSAKANGGTVLLETNKYYSIDLGNGDFGDRFSGAIPDFERESAASLTYARLVSGSDSQEHIVVLRSQITPVSSTVDTLRVQLIFITVILVVLSVGLAVIASRRIARPLSKTNEGAKQLALQNYNATFDASGCREISELNSTLSFAAAELSKANKLQRELIANISHDLRTPLTMITGYAEVMRDIPGENTAENLQVIIDEATRLSSLVSDVLDISRLQSETAVLKLERFCITDSIREIFKRYSKLMAQDGYSISFEHDGDAYVVADELRLSQVMYNLINNAINYAGEDKAVIVRQLVKDGIVRIEITDHGKGIDAQSLKFIWDRYYRAKEHHSAVIGTGLGLSIVKSILDLHGARFGVISAPGQGSTFWFELESNIENSGAKNNHQER